MAGRVIQQQQDPPARHLVTPPCRPGLPARRDVLGGDADGQQQAGQRVGRVDRPLAGGVRVQRQVELPVGEAPGEPVRGVHREGGLADARHAVDDVDRDGSAAAGDVGERVQQPGQVRLPSGEAADVTRESLGRRRRPVGRRGPVPGREGLRGGCPPASGRDERRPFLPGQVQCLGQQLGGVLARGAVDTALQIADRPRADAGRFGQFLLGEPGFGAQLPQQVGKTQLRLRHRQLPLHGPAVAGRR